MPLNLLPSLFNTIGPTATGGRTPISSQWITSSNEEPVAPRAANRSVNWQTTPEGNLRLATPVNTVSGPVVPREPTNAEQALPAFDFSRYNVNNNNDNPDVNNVPATGQYRHLRTPPQEQHQDDGPSGGGPTDPEPYNLPENDFTRSIDRGLTSIGNRVGNFITGPFTGVSGPVTTARDVITNPNLQNISRTAANATRAASLANPALALPALALTGAANVAEFHGNINHAFNNNNVYSNAAQNAAKAAVSPVDYIQSIFSPDYADDDLHDTAIDAAAQEQAQVSLNEFGGFGPSDDAQAVTDVGDDATSQQAAAEAEVSLDEFGGFGPSDDAQAASDGGGGGDDKIVCTMLSRMHQVPNHKGKIWLMHAAKNLTEEHQAGYHKLFCNVTSKMPTSKFWYHTLKHIAVHRTDDVHAEMRNRKRDTLGRIYRAVLEPACYIVGKLIKLDWLKPADISVLNIDKYKK